MYCVMRNVLNGNLSKLYRALVEIRTAVRLLAGEISELLAIPIYP